MREKPNEGKTQTQPKPKPKNPTREKPFGLPNPVT